MLQILDSYPSSSLVFLKSAESTSDLMVFTVKPHDKSASNTTLWSWLNREMNFDLKTNKRKNKNIFCKIENFQR